MLMDHALPCHAMPSHLLNRAERSSVAAVVVAGAGQSYNPSHTDHQQLLANALTHAHRIQQARTLHSAAFNRSALNILMLLQKNHVTPGSIPKPPSHDVILKACYAC